MTDTALVQAQGKLVTFIAILLGRAGIVSAEEFGVLLSLFAVTVSETEPEQGAFLALWADTVSAIVDTEATR